MALNKKKCRVCNKEYRACNPIGLNTGKFRWQAVACSLECGSIYLERLMTSQYKITEPEQIIEAEEAVIIDLYIPESDDNYDIWYDEDESDYEE